MASAALASAALALFAPSIGLEASTGHFGNWQGVFTQKNACGRAMVFSLAACLAQGRINAIRFVCMILFLSVLLMSGSRGAWIIGAALLLCHVAFRGLMRFAPSSRPLLISGALALGGSGIVVAWTLLPSMVLLLGRDVTLSGRTAIWRQVWSAILKHPVAGYGFAAFWQGMRGESYNVILALRFVIFHAHNGFLEIWLELGATGLLFFLLSYVRAWQKLWPVLRSPHMARSSWMFYVLILIAVYDVEENSLLTFNGLFWVLYVATLVNIEILRAECNRDLYFNGQFSSCAIDISERSAAVCKA
jgi:O-antigen ligase